ncbi:MAG: phenylacetate--CoA ligase family protein [Planctomycetaceae bacterium]
MSQANYELNGVLARYFGTPDEPPIEHWPAERIADYQRDAVADQLTHVWEHSPFYQRKFEEAHVTPDDFRTLDDLRRFPFTVKDELRGDPWVLLSVPKNDVCLAHTSTGTTGGDWSYTLYSRDDMYLHDQVPSPRLLMPVRSSDVVIDALPYEMSSAGQSFQRSLQGTASALVVPVGKGGFYSDPVKTVKIMADLKADVLITTPPYAMLLAEIAGQMNISLNDNVRLRFMWLTGEGCSQAYRRRLEELWNCPGIVFYGSMECGSIGIECSEQSGGHVSQGHVHIEIIDPETGEPLPAGEVGEVVCTVLQRKASPLIRFRTQDLAFVDSEPCACGVKFPRVHIRGRIVDQIAGSSDRVARPDQREGRGESRATTGHALRSSGRATPPISPLMIEEVLFAQSEMGGNYQIYSDGNSLLVEAELRTGAGDGRPAKQRIEDMLAERGLQAELRWVEHIPRTGGKTRRIRPLTDRDDVMRQPSILRPNPAETNS